MAFTKSGPKRSGGFGGGAGGNKGHKKGPKAASKPSSRSSSSGLNPFDVRSNAKTKYEVLGKRVKGQGRNVAVARAQAETKRRKTLATQFQKRNKANQFKDKRLGEQDASLSLEDKMIARFQAERKRKMRNAQAFALNDSDRDSDEEGGDELFLTHKGSKITDDYDQMNDFEPDDEDDRDRQLDKEIVERLHFGGGTGAAANSDDPEHKKSHKEIMQEVMMKSKMFKAERQKNKANQDDETENLDKGFSDIRNLLEFRPTRANGKEVVEKTPMDEFDKLTREFAFEAKAKATERRMSPEEAATKEHDRLAELERKRVARMNGEDPDEDEDDHKGKKGKKGKKDKKDKKSDKKKAPQLILMPPTDDDLQDGYQVDQQFAQDVEEQEEGEGEDVEEGEEEVEEEDEEDEDDSEADSDDDEDAEKEDEDAASEEGDEDDEMNEDEDVAADRQLAAQELPFVFPCPETPEDLGALFKKHAKGSSANRSLIIERIYMYYSPRLSVENQNKMKSFYAILIRQFLKWSSQYAIHKDDLDALGKHLFTLAQQMADSAAVIVRELLINLYKRLRSSKTVSKWPSLAELMLFKVLTQIFPTSDLRHNVISPMETLLGEALALGTVSSPQEATQALFAVTLVLHITREKKRFTPEVLIALRKILRAFLTPSLEDSHWLHDQIKEVDASAELPALALTEASSASAASVLRATCKAVEVAAAQYALLPSFDELFHPIYLLLHEITRVFFKGTNVQVNTTIATLHELLAACWDARRPLRLQSFAPSVLPTFAPKFEENYTVRKDKTADKEKAQMKQLTRQVKRARKGAARELRRDAEFLAREKQVEETTRVTDKREKQKEIWRWLEEQNATFNEQAKKGGNMLKGGGSGPAKNRRTKKRD